MKLRYIHIDEYINSGISLDSMLFIKVVSSLQEKSYYALAAFCENMGEEILPFLDPLMGKLISALQSSPRNLQETCMVTLYLHASII